MLEIILRSQEHDMKTPRAPGLPNRDDKCEMIWISDAERAGIILQASTVDIPDETEHDSGQKKRCLENRLEDE